MKIPAILLACLLYSSGCVTGNYRPHTAREKQWLAAAFVGQAADTVSTAIALENGLEEANPIWDDPKDVVIMGIVKAALVGAAYLWGNADPSSRKYTYPALAGSGFFCASWNLWQIGDKE